MIRAPRTRRRAAGVACRLALGMLLAAPTLAKGQAETAGWLAMVTSPYGALVPSVTPAMLGMADEARALGGDIEFRYGRLDDRTTVLNSFGLGTRIGNLGITGVWQVCDDCGSRSLAGLEYDVMIARARRGDPVRALSFAIAARPGLGFGFVSGEGASAFTVATTVDVPMSLSIPAGVELEIIPHVEPGFGNGLVLQGGERDSRFHGTFAAGVTLMDLRPGLGINLGWRRILLDGSPDTWGFGLTYQRVTDIGGFERHVAGRAGRGSRAR